MKVTLAYEYEGHEPDTTVDLPDAEARRLIGDGRARPASKRAKAVQVDTDKTQGE